MSETSQTTSPDATDGTAPPQPTTPPTDTSTTEQPSLLNQPTDKSSEKTDAKPEPGKEGEKPKEPAKPEGAPEKYEAFKVPDGYELDETVSKSASELFKKHNLTQAAAQELVDFYSKNSIDSQAQALKAVKDMRDGWVTTAKALPEIGSELGPNGKVVTAVGRMLDQIGDAKLANEFRQAMDLTGAGDHPAFIQVMYKLASKLTEGAPVRGNNPSRFGQTQPGTERRSPAEEIYPTLAKGQ